jgi:hypothetical protein
MKLKLLLACLIISGNVSALEFSVASELAYDRIKVNSTAITPIVFELSSAVRHSSGMGAELRLGKGIKDNTRNSVTTEVASRAAALVTFTTDLLSTTRVTLGLGYVSTELDSNLNNTGFPGKQSYDGGVVELSVEDRLNYSSSFYWYGGYRSYYRDDDVKISSIGLGARYEF